MTHSTRRALGAFAGIAVASLALSACAGGSSAPAESSGDFTPLTSVKLQLQWLPQAQFAGYYVALDKGYFQEEGFDKVDVVPSGGDIVPQDALVAGDVDFAVAWVPKVLGTMENQGVELTDIAQVFQKSGTTQVSWKDSGITKVDDFEGKRIGSWGFGNEWEIFAAMADKGLDASTVKITTQDFSMNALLDKDVDAAQAMTYNELAQLLETVNPATGKLYTMDDINVISYEDTAGAMLQDAIWADTKRLSDDPAYADAATRFLKAVIKGWVFARDNPTEAADITYKAATAPGVSAFPVGPTHQLWQMNEVNKLIWTGGDFGLIDSAAWDKTVKGALAAKNQDGLNLITTEPPASAYSNDYIEKALTALNDEGVTVDGDYTPIDVTLTEGGQ
ncbi:MAG: ABC transporter substrate-binding protein [Microbacterium sp. 71-36]|uniref:ABC transporter substrate-binding protein n=1 Tax=unclassified Microbacterium TaxID=2609290 RepID=UPI00086D6D9F|nr:MULTISPECIES: ABC transporter substrate-binding protein [unclassified Microbacterium]MBN9212820.1 ABC transporter substrate-binding protein [Microbacterium sp.]ODT36951.1 MAG: ABC transporter substrate-binding protein [Microbacterium sp. SCN 71-17]OJV77479.1 MAG: ABC transporter substrate-binding protein [Microbacterium sp. 71-36]